MSIFDTAGGSPSSEAELASMMKEEAAEPAPAPEPEPVREAEPAAEQQPEPVKEAEGEAKEPEAPKEAEEAEPERGPVDYKALKAEREKRRGLEAELNQLRGEFAATRNMWQQQQQAAQHQAQQAEMARQQGAQQQQEPPPDPEQDPIGALRWERQQREQLQQVIQAQAIETRVTRDYMADAQRFTAQTPDFPAAYQHLLAGRTAELRAQGWQEQQIQAQVQREEFNIALGALRAGRSPAQQAYELAVARGYVKAQAKPAAQAAARVDPALQEARQKAAVSLSEGGKPEKSGELTLEDISKLHGAAQESAIRKYEKTHHRKASIFPE